MSSGKCGASRILGGFAPKVLGNLQCVDFQIFPPDHLIASLMQLPVMAAAKGDREFVADLYPERSGLRKPQVMRIGRLSTAHEAWLRGNKSQMRFVTQPFGLGDGENALVNLSWNEAGCDRNNRGAGGRPSFQFTPTCALSRVTRS